MDVTADNQDGPKVEDDSVNQITEAVASSFKPSRRVRTAPGGVTSDIFGLEGTEDDALSHAPTLQQVKRLLALCIYAIIFAIVV